MTQLLSKASILLLHKSYYRKSFFLFHEYQGRHSTAIKKQRVVSWLIAFCVFSTDNFLGTKYSKLITLSIWIGLWSSAECCRFIFMPTFISIKNQQNCRELMGLLHFTGKEAGQSIVSLLVQLYLLVSNWRRCRICRISASSVIDFIREVSRRLSAASGDIRDTAFLFDRLAITDHRFNSRIISQYVGDLDFESDR